MESVLTVEDLWKSYRSGDRSLEILRGVRLEVAPGSIVAVLGASGAGKSTLLHLIGGLERPDRGRICYGAREITKAREEEREIWRNRYVGFIFQYHHLLAEFTALENVVLPMLLAGRSRRAATERAMELIETVGLSPRCDHRPARLSGGEQQRVALARALANNPRLVLADEPTGNLDRATGENVYQLLYSVARKDQRSWVVATHNEYLAAMADIQWRLDGGVLKPLPTTQPTMRESVTRPADGGAGE